jgi:hypothetical protein
MVFIINNGLSFENENPIFLKSINNILCSTFGPKKYKLNADISILGDTLSYNKCIKLVRDISYQISFLECNNLTFFGLNLKDILIVNDSYIIANSQLLIPIIENKITFTAPFIMPDFSSPELCKIKSIPSTISHKSVYYSLAELVLNFLSDSPNNMTGLETILHTKLYWFLIKNLSTVVETRILVLI